MFYVYLIQSETFPEQRYVGHISDLKKRLNDHNSGFSFHTNKYKPWKLVTYLGFSGEQPAIEFEKYLKTGSGQAFANKRLWKQS
ncbi:MAG: GIY-YIG nuclease family protein [Alphaproteobacteria bacterium]|nr:GIY-YIG nuclease family protein [Alphaproteobacteria bacterium]